MSEPKLRVVDKLLLAAFSLENTGRLPFTAEDLVVSAWTAYPDTFGLAGHVDASGVNLYPDSNRVFAEIMGSKPIRHRGWLVKVGNKTYRLTEAGRERALALSSANGSAVEKISLSRTSKEELERLLAVNATKKYRAGLPDEITFHDACAFWKISARSAAIEFTGNFNNIERLFESATKAAMGQDFTFRHGGTVIGLSDLALLKELQRFMRERFSKEIDVILQRTDQRA
ncbi:MAG: hypothetical protein NT090_02175 [Acidobacteria bacterium]|nr:hypothetical protein [Acidobacteriota bacterium]